MCAEHKNRPAYSVHVNLAVLHVRGINFLSKINNPINLASNYHQNRSPEFELGLSCCTLDEPINSKHCLPLTPLAQCGTLHEPLAYATQCHTHHGSLDYIALHLNLQPGLNRQELSSGHPRGESQVTPAEAALRVYRQCAPWCRGGTSFCARRAVDFVYVLGSKSPSQCLHSMGTMTGLDA